MEASFSDTLRWLLIGAGIAVVAVVYWISRRAASRASGTPPPSRQVAPDFPSDTAPVVREHPEGKPGDEFVPAGVEEQVGQLRQPEGVTDGGESGGRVLVLHVKSRLPQRGFSGTDIMRVAEQVGLERAAGSDGGFFRRPMPGDTPPDDAQPLFYVANIFNPGVFKWTDMESFSTPGLSLFAQLPGALPPLDTFDELLKCARLLAGQLQGVVLDESRSNLTAQTIQHLREDLQAYAMGRTAVLGEDK